MLQVSERFFDSGKIDDCRKLFATLPIKCENKYILFCKKHGIIKENKRRTEMASKAQIKANARYDKTHTKGFYIKLNLDTDADIIAHLDMVGNRQGYIKKLIRNDMMGTQK